MWDQLVEAVPEDDAAQRREVAAFLEQHGLGLDNDVDYTLVIREQQRIIGTCSKARNVLKCFAVRSEYRGAGLSARLTSGIIDRLFAEGISHYFVFTLPDKAEYFESMNFSVLYRGRQAAFLEGGITRIGPRLAEMRQDHGFVHAAPRAALVMNCNPFTLGHQHLVETAAKRGQEVLLFVVEEDRSVFRFADRLRMVQMGTDIFPNVRVIPSTDYIISSATFPSYFLRDSDQRFEAFMEIDAGIFCKHLCEAFDIRVRYVGEEPYCATTARYNETMARVLPENGIELVKIPRLERDNQAISASRVRTLIRQGQVDAIRDLVPESTYQFIKNSSAGQEAIKRIQAGDTPH